MFSVCLAALIGRGSVPPCHREERSACVTWCGFHERLGKWFAANRRCRCVGQAAIVWMRWSLA